ncbi:hypothetical protein Tco_0715976 [Tanacetum coccineum]
MMKAFQDMMHELGEVNPTHAFYNGSRTSKDNEYPSWSTSFKTRRTQKTSSALEDFIYVVIVLDRNIVRVMKEIYDVGGEFDQQENRGSIAQPWARIIKLHSCLVDKGFDISGRLTKRVGNGSDIRFWE